MFYLKEIYQSVKILLLPVPAIHNRQKNIFFAGQSRDQIIALKDEADILKAQSGIVHAFADQCTIEGVFAGIVIFHKPQYVQHRGFARSRLSEDRHIAVIGHMEIDVGQNRPVVRLLHMGQPQIKFLHDAPPPGSCTRNRKVYLLRCR